MLHSVSKRRLAVEAIELGELSVSELPSCSLCGVVNLQTGIAVDK